tara:strand:- start:1143 stop:3281 length:2139 start_codon:yes stop_codon:yes gene_type:complete
MSINPAKIQGVLAKATDQQLMQMLQRPDKIPSMFIQQEIARRKQMRQAQKAEQASLNLPPSEMARQGTQVPRQQMQMQSPMKMATGGQPYNYPMENFMTPQMMDELARRSRAEKKKEMSSDPLGLNLPTGTSALEQMRDKIGPINQVLQGGATVPLADNPPKITMDTGTSLEKMAPIEIPDMLQNYRKVLEQEAKKNNAKTDFSSSEIENQLAQSIQNDEAKLNNTNPLELIRQKIAPQRLETRADTRATSLSPAQIGGVKVNRLDQNFNDLTPSGIRSVPIVPSNYEKEAGIPSQSTNNLTQSGYGHPTETALSTAIANDQYKKQMKAREEGFLPPSVNSSVSRGDRKDNRNTTATNFFDKFINPNANNLRKRRTEIPPPPLSRPTPDNATLNSFVSETPPLPDELSHESPMNSAMRISSIEREAKKAKIIPSSYEKEAGITSQSDNTLVTKNKSPEIESILDNIITIGNSDSPDAPEAKQFKLNDEKLQSLQQSLMDAMKPQATASQRFFQLVAEFGAKVASSDRPGFLAAAGQAMDETMKSMQGMKDEDRAMFIKRAQLGVEFELARRQNEMDMIKFMADRNDASAIRELKVRGLRLDAAIANQRAGNDAAQLAENLRSNKANEKILIDRIAQDRIESDNVARRNRITSLTDALEVLQEQAADPMYDRAKLPQLQNDITNIVAELQRLGGMTPSASGPTPDPMNLLGNI